MIELAPIDYSQPETIERLVRWGNDFTTRHLYRAFPSEAAYRKLDTPEDIQARLNKYPRSTVLLDHWIVSQSKPIGFCTAILDPPQVIGPIPGTAWFGLGILEADFRKKGLGKATLLEAEKRLRALPQVGRIEIGVWTFNPAAERLYRKLGYHEFLPRQGLHAPKDETWWEGKMRTSIRLEKNLKL